MTTPGFVFDAAKTAIENESLDPGAVELYAHIVTAVPSVSAETVDELSIVSSAGYAPVNLTETDWDGELLTAAAIKFASITTAPDRARGFVICQQLGSAPADSDALIYYGTFREASNFIAQPELQSTSIRINFEDGVFRLTGGYLYIGPEWDGVTTLATYPFGAFYVIGTKNYTQGYVNPVATLSPYQVKGLQSSSITSRTGVTNLEFLDHNGERFFAFDFGSSTGIARRIRFAEVLFRVGNVSSVTNVKIEVWGSNSISDLTLDTATVPNLWTLLGDQVFATFNFNADLSLQMSLPDEYYRSIKLVSVTDGFTLALPIRLVEFLDFQLFSEDDLAS
jgi:hypothetical protein